MRIRRVLGEKNEKKPTGIYTYMGQQMHTKCSEVILSKKAFAKIVSDTFSYENDETGGVLIGLICNGKWFVTDVIDAGLNGSTVHTPTYFVYDEKYINHRMEKERLIYKYPRYALGIFHRHPGHLDTFSLPDENTMKDHCLISQHGILSMLVNMDPEFRMTFYYASKEDELFQVKYHIGDDLIPDEYFEVASYDEIAKRYRKNVKLKDKQYSNLTQEKRFGDMDTNEMKKSFEDIAVNVNIAEVSVDTDDDMMLNDPILLAQIAQLEANQYKGKEKVMIPEELFNDKFEGPLYGFMPDTGAYTVTSWGDGGAKIQGSRRIGYKVKALEEISHLMEETTEKSIILFDNKVLLLNPESGTQNEIEYEKYSMIQNLNSRNSGLLESDYMKDSTIVLSGCGSVGSLIAMQMARSGVGNIVLIDPDNLEIHNICRHQLNLSDIGRKKVDAVAEKVRLINPEINVKAFARKFQDVPLHLYEDMIVDREKTIFIGTCDNRVGNANVCNMAKSIGACFAALGFMSRAWGAEIFTMLPGELDYATVFKKPIEEAIVEERRNHHYLHEEDKGIVNFEPGLDVDIEYGTSFFSKIILDILNRKNSSYHMRVFDSLLQLTILAGTQDIPDKFYKKHLAPFTPKSVKFAPEFYEMPKSS